MSVVHWPFAARIAGRAAGRYPLEGTYHDALLSRQAPELVARTAELVAAETNLPWVGDPTVAVVSRREWAEANISAFSRLLAPAEKKLSRRGSRGLGLGRRIAGRVMALIVGIYAVEMIMQGAAVWVGRIVNSVG